MEFLLSIILIFICGLIMVQGENYCPSPIDIAPCLCDDDRINDYVTIDCSLAASESQLQQVFNTATFPLAQYASFNISNNRKIKSLSKNVFGNISFAGIILESNPVLEYIDPVAFENSHNTLKFWYLHDNNKLSIAGFPFAYLESFKALKALQVSSSPLNQMPVVVSQSLTKLILAQDNIPDIPKHVFDSLPNLKSITMTQNPISSLGQGSFKSLSKLEFISLVYNDIQVVQAKAFVHLESLVEIRLNGNHIQNLEPGMIDDCPNLSDLMMSTNSLTHLVADDEPLNGTTLNLGKNRIFSIEKGSFAGLKNGYLRLSFNNIQSLEEDWLKPILEQNNSVELENNPLTCGCDILWLFKDGYLGNFRWPSSSIAAITGSCPDGTSLQHLQEEFYHSLQKKC